MPATTTENDARLEAGQRIAPPCAPKRFEVLDSLRGICALLVATFHLNVMSHVFELALLRNGWMFVDFFFVLGGFVIMTAYGGGRVRTAGDGWRFLLRRLGRVWPLHLATLAVLVAF